MSEIASAYISLVPSLRGFGRETERQLGPIGRQAGNDFSRDFTRAADGTGEQVGDEVERGVGGRAKKIGAGFGKVFGLAAGLGAGVAIAKSIESSLDNEAAADKVAASLGLNDTQAKRFGKIAGNLYKQGFGESFGEVNSAVGDVRSSFRDLVSGADLQKITKQALTFSDVFEIDLPRAVSVAQTVVRSGLAKDATQAFDLMTASAQKVPTALREDVVDAAEEYSKFFSSIGLTGPQAFSALVAGADAGTFGIDLAGDALKEFATRATDLADTGAQQTLANLGLDGGKIANALLSGGKSARKATVKISQGLLGISDDGERASAVAGLFGTQIEDIGKNNITKFLSGLAGGQKELGKFNGSVNRLGDVAYDNASSNLESLKRTITQTFVEAIGGRAIPAIREFSGDLLKKYGPQIAEFGRFFRDDIVPAAKEFIGYLQTNVLPIVKDFAVNTINTVVGLKDEFVTFFGSLKTTFTSIVSILTSLWRLFGEDLKRYISGTLTAIVQVIGGAFQVIAGIFKTIAALLKGDWKGAWDGVKMIVKGAVKVVTGIVGQLWNIIKTAFSAGFTAIKALAKAGWDGVTGLPGKITAALGDLLETLKQKGRDIITGFLNGIKEIGQDAIDYATDLPGKVKDAIGDVGSAVGGLVDDLNPLNKSLAGAFGKMAVTINKGLANINKMTVKELRKAIRKTKNEIERPGGLKEQFDKLTSLYSGVQTSVRDAFRPDLFSGNIADLFSIGTKAKADLKAVIAAFAKLKRINGVSPSFLSSLYASGNTDLILQLAASDAGTIRNASGLYSDTNSLSQSLGTSVANNQYGAKLNSIDKRLEQSNRLLGALAGELADRINKAAKDGRKKGRRR